MPEALGGDKVGSATQSERKHLRDAIARHVAAVDAAVDDPGPVGQNVYAAAAGLRKSVRTFVDATLHAAGHPRVDT